MGEEYVKQHYVPQSYLKRFAERNTNNKGYHIGVRRKNTKGNIILFEKAIDDVAYEKNYYDIDELDDPKFFEHYFSNEIEPLYGNTLTNIISRITLGLTSNFLAVEDRDALSKMIFFQFVRVPKFLERNFAKGPKICKEVANTFLKEYSDILTKKQKQEIRQSKVSESFVRKVVLEMVSSEESLRKFGEVISNGIFIVSYNNTGIPFVTSDNPVILYNFKNQNMEYGDNGIANPDTVILFPISPKIMIEVAPPGLKAGGGRAVDGKIITLNESNNNDIAFVIRVNMLQMQHATAESYIPPSFMAYIKEIDKMEG